MSNDTQKITELANDYINKMMNEEGEQQSEFDTIDVYYTDLDLEMRTKVRDAIIEQMNLDRNDESVTTNLDSQLSEVPLFVLDVDDVIRMMNFNF